MIRHLFTLVWNRKRANALLIAEIFLAFMVLFAVGSLGVYLRQNYQSPLGFDYDNVWQISLNPGAQTPAAQFGTLQRVLQRLRATPGVVAFSRSQSNTPFAFSNNNTYLEAGKAADKRVIDPVEYYDSSPDMRVVMGLQLREGRWFDRRDEAAARRPVVINELVRDALFAPGQSALGQVISSGNEEFQVVGVSGPYRAGGELSAPGLAMFTYVGPQDTARALTTLLVRVRPGSGAVLEKQLNNDIRATSDGWTSTITPLAEQRLTQLKVKLTAPVILSVMCVFLIINVALGLFGVLWQTIQQRRAEIGLRRAIGASAGGISAQILGEIMVVTTFGLGLGLLVAAQFPLLGVLGVPVGVYGLSMLLAVGLIYALTAGCALYPSQLAARIRPAVALREE